MSATVQRPAVNPPSPSSTPRMVLAPARAGRAVLDGGWWPRSTDPVAELPGLVAALGERFGQVRQLMLNSHTWDTAVRRLPVGERVVRIGWYSSVDPALLIATTERGDQIDLLVVPPGTAGPTANAAMTRAADQANLLRAPAVLAAGPPAGTRP